MIPWSINPRRRRGGPAAPGIGPTRRAGGRRGPARPSRVSQRDRQAAHDGRFRRQRETESLPIAGPSSGSPPASGTVLFSSAEQFRRRGGSAPRGRPRKACLLQNASPSDSALVLHANLSLTLKVRQPLRLAGPQRAAPFPGRTPPVAMPVCTGRHSGPLTSQGWVASDAKGNVRILPPNLETLNGVPAAPESSRQRPSGCRYRRRFRRSHPRCTAGEICETGCSVRSACTTIAAAVAGSNGACYLTCF